MTGDLQILTGIGRAGIMKPMKAMILAAGLGTRLLPLTERTPKPLFPILGQPLIDILIRQLEDAGCHAVIVNTHHLAPLIDEFIKAQAYGIPVLTRHEPEILGTGGGIKNAEDFWDKEPFLVMNGDILSNIDLGKVYRFHMSHEDPVTLVLHDYAQYNHVWTDSENLVRGFGHGEPCPPEKQHSGLRKAAYTGIQVLDPSILSFMPQEGFCNIVDVFCEMLRNGLAIRGFVAEHHYWHDIGTPEGYGEAVREALARKAFAKSVPAAASECLRWSNLKGDGSDRTWYRVAPAPSRGMEGARVSEERFQEPSLIVVDHGSPRGRRICEADAFAGIGEHLYRAGVPVPRIFAYDRPSGLVALEDLGDDHLQQLIQRSRDTDEAGALYKTVIDGLIAMGTQGAKGFDLQLAYQTPVYDQNMILEREARYFVEAFLKDYVGLKIDYKSLEPEFEVCAERAVEHPYKGFLHRDFQSRNILVKDGDYYFIDFQGARLGPLQYDLASLLIDPYVNLPQDLQDALLDYYMEKLSAFMPVDRDLFFDGYRFCALNRNLQILGAFAYLSRQKGKKEFEAYIPAALLSLKARLGDLEEDVCVRLRGVVEGLPVMKV